MACGILVPGPGSVWCLDQGSNPFPTLPSTPPVQWKGGLFNLWIVRKVPGTLTSCFKPFVIIHGQGFLLFAYVCISKENLFLSNMFYEMLAVFIDQARQYNRVIWYWISSLGSALSVRISDVGGCRGNLKPLWHRQHTGDHEHWRWVNRKNSCFLCVCANLLQLYPTLYDPMDRSLPGSCPWDSSGKNTEVGCHALCQGIFPNQGLNLHLLCLLHWQAGFFYH